MTYEIKIENSFIEPILNGSKTFEIRKNDRRYQKGDHIVFIPFDERGVLDNTHPIKSHIYEITYVLSGWGIKKDYVVFSFRELNSF